MPPLYEFVCEECKSIVEVLQKSTDAPPECEVHKAEMKKILSVPFFRFRGAGCYAVDYAPQKLGKYEEDD